MRSIIAFFTLVSSLTCMAAQTVSLSPRQEVGTFNWYTDGSTRMAVAEVVPRDVDGDGVDEIFFYGLETQPNTPQEYSNTSMFVFGWEDGQLVNLTGKWLPGGLNEVEGVGEIEFGDFNGDGLVDLYLAANTDMPHPVTAFALLNQGDRFTRQNLGLGNEQHGVSVGDLNGDGYDDVFAGGYQAPFAVYLGGPGGLTKHVLTGHDPATNRWYGNTEGFGSDSLIGDFYGDGSQVLVTFDGLDRPADTSLATLLISRGVPIVLIKGPSLPRPVLTRPEWVAAGVTDSHDIRALTFDFTSDGLDDIVVFSRAWLDAQGRWPHISAVQFLANRAGGVFDDVTDELLVGYDHESGAAYSPLLRDFDGDGRLDIFVAEADFEQVHNSHAFLFQQEDGRFLDVARDRFSRFFTPNDHGGSGTVAKGPGGRWHFVGFESHYGDPDVRVFASALSVSQQRGIVNISTRGLTGPGKSMHGGFVIRDGEKTLLLKALGPTLAGRAVSGSLANPKLAVYRGQQVIAESDDWRQGGECSGFNGDEPEYDSEPCVSVTLPAGAYTAVLSGVSGETGKAILSVNDVGGAGSIVNLSTRGQVVPGEENLTGGFVIRGEPQTIAVRALGPTLADSGVAGVLPDPRIALYSGQTMLDSNDDWADGGCAGSGFEPSHPGEACLVRTLAPGAYTAIVSSADGQPGIATVSINRVLP